MPVVSRRACDRCHTQKLRCPRNGGDNTDSCSRCLQAGYRCVYSAPLPTGRPPLSSITKRKPPRDKTGSTISAPTTIGADSFMNPTAWTTPNIDEYPLEPAMNSNIAASWPTNLPELTNIEYPGLGDSASKGVGLFANSDAFQSHTMPPEHLSASLESNFRSSSGVLLLPTQCDAIETCIRELSDLSVRLYPVQKACLQFTGGRRKHSQAYPELELSSSAFNTIVILLQEVGSSRESKSHGRNVLAEIFEAPRILVGIARRLSGLLAKRLPNQSGSSASTISDSGSERDHELMTPASLTSTCASTPFENSPTTALSSIVAPLNGSLPAYGGMSSDSSTNHLVLSCYVRLLHIYDVLIRAFQEDACELTMTNSSSPQMNEELRLILITQLITSLLERLRLTIGTYFSSFPPLANHVILNPQFEMQGLLLSSASGLENQVQENLKRLQTMLPLG